MTTSDYALVVSITSLFASFCTLIWNVWQKFIFVRPSVQVSFVLMSVLQPSDDGVAHPTGQKLLLLVATNMGPGAVVLYACIAKSRSSWWKKALIGILNPIHGDPTSAVATSLGPFSAGLPVKIDAGDSKSFYFPYNADCFLGEPLLRVGVNDTYYRNAWCQRRDVLKVMEYFHADFPPPPQPS